MRTRRASKWVLVAGLVGAALACGLPSSAPPTTAPPAAPTEAIETGVSYVELSVVNGMPAELCTLYISATGEAAWGANWLGAGATIARGESVTFGLPPGAYDLRGESCDGALRGEARGVALKAATAVTLEAGPGGQGGAGEAAPAEVVVPLWQDCPQPPIRPGDEVVIRADWITDTPQQAEDNAAQMGLSAWVDGQLVPGVESLSHAVGTTAQLEAVGCPGGPPAPLAYWDIPLGRLPAGSHRVEVEYFADAQIYDGYNTYPAGSLGIVERVIQVGDGDEGAGGAGERVALTMVNDTSQVVCFALIGSPASEWVGDLLGGDTLMPGDRLTVEVVPGTWALQAQGCGGEVLDFRASFAVTEPTEWVIAE